MAVKSNIQKLYERLSLVSSINHPSIRKETIDRINSITRSKEDTLDITAHIYALMAYHEDKNVVEITEYPGQFRKLLSKKIYYELSDIDEVLIRILYCFIMDK